jgi:glycosyltransferase involved in cell wall biosynthesis
MRNLTIAIPTYNRRERLLNQLHSIFAQPLSREVKVIVINNHSNYDVEEAIKQEFDTTNLSNLEVVNHPFNIGLAINIAMPFYHCKTEWLWILSDDDETVPTSLATICEDIEAKYSDCLVLKYSLQGHFDHKNEEITDLNVLVDYYDSKKPRFLSHGEFIFISNGVFNCKKLEPIIGDIFGYSYNAVLAINPIIFGLDKKLGKCVFRDAYIVSIKAPSPGNHWNVRNIFMQIANLRDYPFTADGKTINRVNSLVNFYGTMVFIGGCLETNDRRKMKIFYDKVFHSMIFDWSPMSIVGFFCFWIYYLTGINTFKMLLSLKVRK